MFGITIENDIRQGRHEFVLQSLTYFLYVLIVISHLSLGQLAGVAIEKTSGTEPEAVCLAALREATPGGSSEGVVPRQERCNRRENKAELSDAPLGHADAVESLQVVEGIPQPEEGQEGGHVTGAQQPS